MTSDRQPFDHNILRSFIKECRRSKSRVKVRDSLGRELTGGRLLAGSLAFRRMLLRDVVGSDERFVGVLVPPSVGGVLANTALPLAGRVAVNLNYTVSGGIMNSCIRQCGIKHVLTTKRMLNNPMTEKLMPEIEAELVFLEDLAEQKVQKADKLIGAALAYACPLPILERLLGIHNVRPDDLMTLLFTSGSTGDPKGVMLTHQNIASNVAAIGQRVPLNDRDVAIGVMPFFHSYGYTATLWTALTLPPSGAYHFSPLDARQIGKLCKENHATILMTTPTFLRSYTKRCDEDQLNTLEVVFASAEKLSSDVADAFERKFGVRPMEAYGATELSPLVSVNVPPGRTGNQPILCRDGSVGKPIPWVKTKLIDRDTGGTPAPGKPGMLYVGGPSVMKGYYNRPDLTAEVLKDGWYCTGDLALVDDDGFLHITGRESRFSKIGGEMVPHIKIEEIVHRILGADDDELMVAVTAVPDPKKGERLVVLHRPLSVQPQSICKEMAERGLPNIWIPSADSFCEVAEIPVLGTGKLDLRKLKEVALEKFSSAA